MIDAVNNPGLQVMIAGIVGVLRHFYCFFIVSVFRGV